MSDLPFIPWRPGLPRETCVCDVRDHLGRVHRTVLARGGANPLVRIGPRKYLITPTYVTEACISWRPIPIPVGVLGAHAGGDVTR